MADYDVFAHGGAQYPLTSSTANSLLRDADPAIFYALDFLAWSLERYMGERIAEIVAASGFGTTQITGACAGSVPYDPTDYLTEQQFKFPLLAMWRTEDKLKEQNSVARSNACEVEIAYILPPLTGSQAEALIPALRAAVAIIDKSVRRGWNASYTPPNGAAGDVVWGDEAANIQAIDVTTARYGHVPGLDGSGLKFPAVVIGAVIHERDEAVAGAFEAMAGADVAVDLKDSDADTNVADFVEFAVETD